MSKSNNEVSLQQLKQVIPQLISLYGSSNWLIIMQDLNVVAGKPNKLVTNLNKGVLAINSIEPDLTSVNLNKIYAIVIFEPYNQSIMYIPNPVKEPTTGTTPSISDILATLPADTPVILRLKDLVISHYILANYNGIVVLDNYNGFVVLNSSAIISFRSA